MMQVLRVQRVMDMLKGMRLVVKRIRILKITLKGMSKRRRIRMKKGMMIKIIMTIEMRIIKIIMVIEMRIIKIIKMVITLIEMTIEISTLKIIKKMLVVIKFPDLNITIGL